MEKKYRILGVIPARGGSKGIPRKNLVPLLGRPLIAYSIVEALKSKMLTRVIVSTEDDEIAEISKKYGADIPWKRPMEFATDEALAMPMMKHAVLATEEAEGEKYDYVVMLHPTTPLRTAEDIDGAVERMIKAGADSVISVVDVGGSHPMRMKKIGENHELIDYEHDPKEMTPRQELPKVYIRSGEVYGVKRDVLVNGNSLKGKKSVAWITPKERSVNIDTMFDLIKAEYVMKNVVKKDWSYVKPIEKKD